MVSKGRQAKGLEHGMYTHPESRMYGEQNGMVRHPERHARGDKSGARLHPECLARGGCHGSAKLTWAEVNVIRERYKQGHVSYRVLAGEYDVHMAQIWRIVNGKTWVIPTRAEAICRVILALTETK